MTITEANTSGYVRALITTAPGAWRFTEDHPVFVKAMSAGINWLIDPTHQAEAFWEAIAALDDPHAI